MSEVWTESQPLLSVTELLGMLLILILCERPACDIAASTTRDTIPMWEQKLQTTEAIPLFTIAVQYMYLRSCLKFNFAGMPAVKTFNVPIPSIDHEQYARQDRHVCGR